MQKLSVGEQYPEEMMNGVYFDYNNGFTLYLFLPNLTEKEVESIRGGGYRFALTEISDMLVFLYEFKNGIKLSDVPFHFNLSQGDIKELPDVVDDPEGLTLNVIAVDSTTGIVQALRLIGLGTRFSKKLINICEKQSEQTVDQNQHNINVSNLQQKYQAKDLIKFASVICKG